MVWHSGDQTLYPCRILEVDLNHYPHRLKVTTRASHADEEAVLSELEKNAAYYLVHYGDLSWAGA